MEQIVRRDGQIYYGERRCIDADDAYRRFRDDYHRSLGRIAYERLNRIGQREERVHGYGFVYQSEVDFGGMDGGAVGKVPVRILGIVAGAYCRGVGAWDIPCESDEEFERWFEWAFARGSGVLRLVGRNDRAGRSSKRNNVRYR